MNRWMRRGLIAIAAVLAGIVGLTPAAQAFGDDGVNDVTILMHVDVHNQTELENALALDDASFVIFLHGHEGKPYRIPAKPRQGIEIYTVAPVKVYVADRHWATWLKNEHGGTVECPAGNTCILF